MRLLGIEIIQKRLERNENPSFVAPSNDDGAVIVSAGGSFGTMVDLDGTIRTEAELVSKYRDMGMHPDCDMAIAEIVNEAICVGEESDVVKIRLDDLDMISDNAKKAIEDEFTLTLKMLQFNRSGHDLFQKWYVDGRLYFHVIVDEEDLLSGIQEIRYIDPRKIRKVREVTRKPMQGKNASQLGGTDATIPEVVNEYYVFNEKGFGGQSIAGQQRSQMPATGLKIALDSIIHVVSGVTDSSATTVLGYLHKAIKPLNQLKTLEDATVVYRLVRAPERRVWKIDVGNLPKVKAEQYIRNVMVQYKNRLVYDSTTGQVMDDRRYLTMLEDIWLPTRGDGRGDGVETLPAGELTGVLDDVLYFKQKLFNSLNVPVARLNPENIFTSGRATEITRDEIKFGKFIFKIRMKFCDLFLQVLEKQLILKNKITYDDWKQIKSLIKFDFVVDNSFAELKDLDIMNDRLNVLALLDQWASKYYSHEWIRKNILKQTDDDIAEIDKQIADEAENAQLHPELLAPQMGMDLEPTTGPTNEPIPQAGPLMQPPDSNLPGGPASITQDKPLMGKPSAGMGGAKTAMSQNKKSKQSGSDKK